MPVVLDSWSIRPTAGNISGNAQDRPTIMFDTTARQHAVEQTESQKSLAFFILNDGPRAPEGLLLMTHGSGEDPPPDLDLLTSMQPSVPKVSLQYERVGYIFTPSKDVERPRQPRRPQRSWSVDLDNNDSLSSEEYVEQPHRTLRGWSPDSDNIHSSSLSSSEKNTSKHTTRQDWDVFASIQTFALY